MRVIVFLVGLGMGSLVAASQSEHPRLVFPEPTTEMRPWGICHWLGNAVEKDELAKEMTRWAEAGLGGIRIIPIYGVKGNEANNVAFMSETFVGKLADANALAAARGMKVDCSFGAGWCFGGRATPPELGAQGLKVVKSGEWRPARHCVLWEKDGTALIAYYTEQQVKRAQELDAGPMLNPYSPAALTAHLDLFKNLDGHTDAYPRATFHDSFEYYGAGWSDEFPALFQKYRGYAITDHFPELAGVGDPATVARVKCDYRETLSDILVRETFPIWTAWCRARGILTHNQAHGAPANLLEFYAIADTPETEMFGRGDRDKFTSRFDTDFRAGDRDPLMSKFASSAAHLTGKRFTSAESFTWMAEHFCETPEEMKAFGDLLFLSGVNRLYYHATVFSPDSAPWPGWCLYAASELNPRNPLWRDIRPLNDYFTRVQSLLADAQPDNDVLLYWPIHDQWTKAEGFEDLLSVHSPWIAALPFGRLARRLTDAGYQFDYVSDAFLTDEIVARYKAIVVPETKVMKAATFARLAELSRRMPVIFEKTLPQTTPGLLSRPLDTAPAPQPVADAVIALEQTGVRSIDAFRKPWPFEGLRLNWKGGKLYFVVNTSQKKAMLRMDQSVTILDPLTGDVDPLLISHPTSHVDYVVEPGHSLFVWSAAVQTADEVFCPAWYPESETEIAWQTVALASPWSLTFVRDVSGWPLPPVRADLSAPGDWTKLGEAEAAFSGTAVYRTTFMLDEVPEAVRIKLGDVRHTARVRVNGTTARPGTVFMRPYEVQVPARDLVVGTNTLEVEVTNLGANRIRAYDRKGVAWKVFENANMAGWGVGGVLDASSWPVLPSGLLGPVTIQRLPNVK